LWVRDQPDLVDASYGHERDQRQERGGLVAGEDEVLDRAARRVEEVFGVAAAGAVEVDRRLRLSPDVTWRKMAQSTTAALSTRSMWSPNKFTEKINL